MNKHIIPILVILLFIISAVSPMVIGFKSDAVDEIDVEIKPESLVGSGPMDSPWPMKCHDTHHTSRSPYSTTHITGLEKWRFRCDGVDGSPIIGDDGTI